MITRKHEYDELIFDYLEGNLSSKEKEAFEILLSDDSYLKNEVDAWRNTFVAEDLSVTTSLEQVIIASYKRTKWALLLNAILYLPLVVLFSSATVNKDPKPIVTEPKDFDKVELVSMPQCTSPNITQQGINHSNKNAKPVVIRARKEQQPVTEQEQIITFYKLPLLEINITIPTVVSRSKIELANEFATKDISTQTHKRQFLRKQIRALNRKKRRESDKASQIKFTKGRVPYVVPLDPSNF